MPIKFKLNNIEQETDVGADVPLLYVLRNDFGLNGPKFGCGRGQCGACAVLLDGASALACLLPLSAVAGKHVRTLEGLGNRESPHALQEAFLQEQALQCGYCGNGVLMAAASLLESNPNPTEQDIRKALRGNLCRCGAQGRIIKAILRAAESLS